MYTLRDWQSLQKSQKEIIVNASTPNGMDFQEPFPIGVSYKYEKQSLIGKHENLVLCAVSPETDKINVSNRKTSRKDVIKKMKAVGIINQALSPDVYFDELPKYKFIVSPAGNGVDCHRHYEALMAGCIPIVEVHSHILKTYGNCPILYTRDYSEITPEYLERQYSNMIDNTYDFSKLFKSSYSAELQERMNSNMLFYRYTRIKPASRYSPSWMNLRGRQKPGVDLF